ncbi:beta-N-acetylhexosaminidase [Mycetocola tolaasinivorans]|nr:beta-N-acetylhexosaminidase [Mycetocola tolaasinivorans]
MTALLPQPRSISQPDAGSYTLTDSTRIAADPALRDAARWLQQVLRPATGLDLDSADANGSADSSDHGVVFRHDTALGAEAYRLRVSDSGVAIDAGGPAGAFYGAQVLRQLLPVAAYRTAVIAPDTEWLLPAVSIEDAPTFGWRGVMLDVARHFMPKADVLRFIDLMALHRLNVLHLHLTEDQGWRIEIRRYPKLTEVGAWRRESQRGPVRDAPGDGRPHGGFYTQDDIREIVAYADARHISVVPEIDLPGHSQAAIAAYPELGIGVDASGRGGPDLEVFTRWGINPNVLNTEDSTVEFFRNVLDEVMDLFPSSHIGIGGDECPTEQWEADARTHELVRERGLPDVHALHGWFLNALSTHIVARGRRPFGWDELLEGDPHPDSVIASWRGMTGARTAIRRGFPVVSCPDEQVYLDYRQSEMPEEPIQVGVPLSVADVYAFSPVPPEATPEQAALILGGQANIWTEHLSSTRAVDYAAFPRLCALAETLWGTGGDLTEFEGRLREHLARLDALGVEYRPESGPLPWQQRPDVPGRPSTRAERAAHVASLVANIME